MSAVLELKERVKQHLVKQGYSLADNGLTLASESRHSYRCAQSVARLSKLRQQAGFLIANKQLALNHVIDGSKLEIDKIKPRLIEVKAGTKWETLFRWWCLAWWSVPYEKPIGRQMRFILWDSYHKSIIGLIGLQSPILAWAPRDDYLGLTDNREFWVNQSMNAQRVGALPPYNQILGSRLVASMLVSKELRSAFRIKYKDRKTEMKQRLLPNRMLFITTTGAFGKSPIYDRLSHGGHKLSFFLGYTKGYGSFHIDDGLYKEMLGCLKSNNVNTSRGYGTGPSRKMKLISLAMNQLGLEQYKKHQIRRGLYMFTTVRNLADVIHKDRSPRYHNLSVKELSDFWKERWIIPRLEKRQEYRLFNAEEYVDRELRSVASHG